MGAFKIEIVGVGGHGCDRKAKAGDKLYGRCGRFSCPDCEAFDFVQRLRQKGMIRENDLAYSIEVPADCEGYPGSSRIEEVQGKHYAQFHHKAEFTHWPQTATQVVDDMLKNERKEGQF